MSDVDYKHQVAHSFGHATATYNSYATVQQQCAQTLMAIFQSLQDQLPEGGILELGCGTGLVTKALLDLEGDRPLTITDLSPQMLACCQQTLNLTPAQRQRICFQQMDGEAISSRCDPYAAIISGFVVQWFERPLQSLQALIAALKPRGILLASFPTHQSFPEWRQICEQRGLPFTANALPNPRVLTAQLIREGVTCVWHEQTICTTYDQAIAFLRSLKLIGAGPNRAAQTLSPMQMKQLIHAWDQQSPGKIQVHYQIAFLVVQTG